MPHIKYEVRNGDLVDFGGYGQYYVVDGADRDRFYDFPHSFWVTKNRADRYNPDALGHFIAKSDAVAIVEAGKNHEGSVDIQDKYRADNPHSYDDEQLGLIRGFDSGTEAINAMGRTRCVCCGGNLTQFNDPKDTGMCFACTDPAHTHGPMRRPDCGCGSQHVHSHRRSK